MAGTLNLYDLLGSGVGYSMGVGIVQSLSLALVLHVGQIGVSPGDVLDQRAG